MRDADYISESAYQAAAAQPLALDRGQIYTRIREPFFFSYVRELLIDEYGATAVRAAASRSTRPSTRATSASPSTR